MDATPPSDLLKVASIVRQGTARTRGEISRALSIRSSTVSELVGELVANDLLLESLVRTSGRGRPTAALRFNDQRFGAIFVSVVDRRLVAKAVDLSYRVLAELDCVPPDDADNTRMAACIRDLVERMAQSFPAGIELAAVVLSLSGLLDVARGIWCFSSRWPALSNLPVTDAFAHLPWPVTLVRNLDAELAGIRMAQDYPAQESILLLHWGHGIGASLYTDGAVINRERGRFCEIGHWGLGNSKGRPCTCGNRDCLETVAALWALGPQLRAAFPDLPLDESSLALELGRIDLMSVGAMQEALSQMLRLTANLCRLFFPDRVILTGPFVQNPLIFRQFVDAISSAPLVRSLDIVRVSVNEIGQRDEILGALSQPFAALLEGFLGGGSQ